MGVLALLSLLQGTSLRSYEGDHLITLLRSCQVLTLFVHVGAFRFARAVKSARFVRAKWIKSGVHRGLPSQPTI